MDANNDKPAAESKPFRVWKPWEAVATTGAVVLLAAFFASLTVSWPNTPKGADGKPAPIFFKVFYPSTVSEGQEAYRQSLVRKKNEAYHSMVKNAQDMLQARKDSAARAAMAIKKMKPRTQAAPSKKPMRIPQKH